MKSNIENNYTVELNTDDKLISCIIQSDENLKKRSISNLIQNCINNNENGCTIYVMVHTIQNKCMIIVEDDGVGATDDQIEKLNNTPHYRSEERRVGKEWKTRSVTYE